MMSWLRNVVTVVSRYFRVLKYNNDDDDDDDDDELDSYIWSRDLHNHFLGDYSFAVVQANHVIEDYSQVETSPFSTFVGVYDGHGGPEASRFISDHLFPNLIRLAKEKCGISEEVLRSAFSATENGFLAFVRRTYGINPLIAAVGSCCLVGVIWKGTLLVANLGDSRAVVGCLGKSNKLVAEQLTKDHNASVEEVRQELKALHPDDPHIVVLKQGVWRIKGLIQVSRSIGDAYLKRPEFSIDPAFPRFHLHEPIRRPVLTSEPSILSRSLRPDDKFVIFASDGLWEHVSNQEAVEIVYSNQRAGIARRLVKAALDIAARKGKLKYSELKNVEKGLRRCIHDDITVVVIFIDELAVSGDSIPGLSVRGFADTAQPSKFEILQGLDENSKSILSS